MVPRVGLEPTRPKGHRILSPARLPIPPPGHSSNLNIVERENASTANLMKKQVAKAKMQKSAKPSPISRFRG